MLATRTGSMYITLSYLTGLENAGDAVSEIPHWITELLTVTLSTNQGLISTKTKGIAS